MAHLGVQKTLHMISTQFYWPHMADDIRKYIESCTSCQSNKTDRRRRVPPLSPLVPPTSCWRTLGVDLIVDLPPSAEGHTAVCVFDCHLSKMVRLVDTTNDLSTVQFVQLFMRDIFPHYGFPLNIVSDRGSQWNSKFFKALCSAAGVKLSLSTAYHPQTNGLTERTNEVVSAALRHYVSADMKDWHLQLPLVEFAMNSSYHEAIQSTPVRMNRITLPANPFDALIASTQHVSTEAAS